MFGILMIIFVFFCWLIKTSKTTSEDNYRSTFTGDDYTYRDHAGVMRTKGKNKPVFDKVDPKTGHRILYDKHHNKVLDTTEAEMLKFTSEHPGESYKYDKWYLAGYYIKRFAKQVDGEVKFYTIMHYKDADFIVDLQDFKIIAPTNNQLRYELNCKAKGYLYYTEEGFQEVVNGFNNMHEIDRKDLIAEGADSALSMPQRNGLWTEFLYNDRKPKKQWSYFSQKGYLMKGDKPWIH